MTSHDLLDVVLDGYGHNYKPRVIEEIGKLKRKHPSFEPREATIEEKDGTTSLVISVEGTLRTTNNKNVGSSDNNSSSNKMQKEQQAYVKIFLPRTFPIYPPFVFLFLPFTDPPSRMTIMSEQGRVRWKRKRGTMLDGTVFKVDEGGFEEEGVIGDTANYGGVSALSTNILASLRDWTKSSLLQLVDDLQAYLSLPIVSSTNSAMSSTIAANNTQHEDNGAKELTEEEQTSQPQHKNAPPPYEKNVKKLVEEKIIHQLGKYNNYMQGEIASQQLLQTKLQQNRSAITDVSHFLEQSIIEFTEKIDYISTRDRDLELLLSSLQTCDSSADLPITVDDRLVPPDPVAKQLLDTTTEDIGIEDTLYIMHQALMKSKLDLSSYLQVFNLPLSPTTNN
eukprot:TRINITY_DN5734_c0_g1_i2.p1 TRINITY_DN5734_c0_g1~~TRINITY_DN5734_c0_g1_i2.p1  ORF type:complete len:408 (-),score=76.93 TRINITY_DN5734_c0_g1_i2:86-1264(-)